MTTPTYHRGKRNFGTGFDMMKRIEELEAAQAWQQIETAPSDHMLFYGNTRHDDGVVFTGWKAQNGLCYADTGHIVKATHWMPLPAPPKETK